MKATTKFLLVCTAIGYLCALAGLVDLFLTQSGYAEHLIMIGLSSGELFGALVLTLSGHFIRSRYFLWFKICLGLLALGIVLKILHLTGGGLLLLAAYTGVFIAYLMHYLQSGLRRGLKSVKLLWLALFSLGAMFGILRVDIDLSYITPLIMILLVVDFIVRRRYLDHLPPVNVLKAL